jgi:cell division septal protein FtsQ
MEPEYSREAGNRGGRSRMKWYVILLIAIVLLYAGYSLLIIKHLEIHTISRISPREVALSAGLGQRVNLLTLSENKIRAGINSNRYLIYQRMEKRFPDTLVLYVKERIRCANVQHNGIQYLLDDQGMVLERDAVMALGNTLISVTGLDLRDIRTGNVIVCRQTEQLHSYIAVIEELKAQNYAGEISVINLSDIHNIYLITVSGYTVTVGDDTQMRAKIGTVRAVIEKLREMGKTGGMIQAGAPGVATYSPDDALNIQQH